MRMRNIDLIWELLLPHFRYLHFYTFLEIERMQRNKKVKCNKEHLRIFTRQKFPTI